MTEPSSEVGPDLQYQIEGGAGAYEAAAIVAAVSQVLNEQLVALAVPPIRPEQNRWVTAWRPQPVESPVRSDTAHYLGAWRAAAAAGEEEEPLE